MLFANQAIFIIFPGNAYPAVDFRQTQPGLKFLRLGKLGDGARRADISAKSAMILAITDLRDQLRGPHSGKPGSEQSRLKAVSNTDFHAISAAHAAIKKFFFL